MGCIILGVTGGIAAYKAVDIARQFSLLGFDVKVIMTEHATRLVGPTTFRAVTGNEVSCCMFAGEGVPMRHISLAREADLVVVAPATANVLAKMANGIADDLLSTTLLATRAPVLAAPAMNLEMWRHPATQANVELLRSRGVRMVGPESGILACGEEGVGRMSEPEAVVSSALEMLGIGGRLRGATVLVTAGGTREPIDPVRFVGNRSSGKMGYALAEVAAHMGAKVTLISAPTHLEQPRGVELVRVETAEEMRREVTARAAQCAVVVMAAAVADFTPDGASGEKIKRGGRESLKLELLPTADILKQVAEERKPGQLLVGFAAETVDVVRNAEGKLQEKGADMMVANDVTSPGSGFDADLNRAVLLFRDGRVVELDLMPKRELAALIWQEVARLLQAPS